MAKKKLSTAKKEELRKKMVAFRMEAEEGNVSTFKRMTINERFKIGHHWDHDDKTYNEANGKFALTINEVLPIILDIAGTQEENPLDYKVRNLKGGTQTIAELLTSLAKKVMDDSMGREESSRAFESGVTAARGFLQVSINYNNDPLNGDFAIKELDPFMVLPDPTCREYDYNAEKGGAKYIIVDEWVDKDKVKAENPDVDLEDAHFNFTRDTLFGRFRDLMGHLFGAGPDLHLRDDYRQHDDLILDDESHTSKQINNFRISTFWWKEWKKGVYVQKLDDPLNYLALTNTKDIADAKRLAQDNPNLKIIDKDRDENPLTVAVLNKTTMIGDKLLSHVEDTFGGMNRYPVVRFAPYFDHGYEYPPVQNLVGPQKLINYSFSTLVNILKNLANTGWITGKSSEKKKQELEDHGNQDGIVLDKTDYGGILEKIKNNDYPVGFDVVTERSKQNMREVAQVQLEVPRRTGSPESGRALAIKERQSIKTKGIIFRNWNQTNILIARVLIELIRNTNIFSDDEIMAVVDEDDLLDPEILDQAKGIVLNVIQQQGGTIPTQPPIINPIRIRNAEPEMQAEMIDKFQDETALYEQFISQVEQAAIPIAKQIILELLRNMQQGRYGIKVDTSPMAPTIRMARSIEIRELHRSLIEGGHPGVSRKQLVEATDVPNKEEIIAEVPQVVGAVA